MKTYDPNTSWSIQTVEITYMMWDYTATALVTVRGNCKGLSILRAAIDYHANDLYEKHGDAVELVLTRPAEDGCGEDTLTTYPNEEGANSLDDFLEEMCVGLKIIKREELADKAGDSAVEASS